MVAGVGTYMRPQQRIVTDCDLPAIKERTPKIDIDIIPDSNVLTEFTGKIGLQPDALTYFLEELVHDLLTSVDFLVFSTVKRLEQFLGSNPQIEQVRIKIIVDLMFLHFIPLCHIRYF